MLGILRLVLASCVALSHAGLDVLGYHLGVPAVVVFYVLAGYVVALQWDGFSRGRALSGATALFFRDRLLRLLPTYFLGLAVVGAVALALHPDTFFLSRPFDAACAAGNLLVVPLNWFAFNGLDRCSVIPVAWSLGLEMQFYILVPLLLRFPRIAVGLALGSVGVFLCATLGIFDADIWGYRLLPGTLFIFLLGALLGAGVLAKGGQERAFRILWAVAGGAALVALWVANSPRAQVDFAFETNLGIALAIPLVILGLKFGRSRLDDLCGAIAYPLFLVHFAVLWTFETLLGGPITGLALVPYLACALVLALGLTRVEAPISAWRRRLRREGLKRGAAPDPGVA